MFFDSDPSLRIDYVLVYTDELDQKGTTKRESYEQNLRDNGLVLETEDKAVRMGREPGLGGNGVGLWYTRHGGGRPSVGWDGTIVVNMKTKILLGMHVCVALCLQESQDGKTFYVKCSITWEALTTGAELLFMEKKIKMPKVRKS